MDDQSTPNPEDIIRLIGVTETVRAIFVSEKLAEDGEIVEEVLITAHFNDESVVTIHTGELWYGLSWILCICNMLRGGGDVPAGPIDLNLN